jgi:hypothetical protein
MYRIQNDRTKLFRTPKGWKHLEMSFDSEFETYPTEQLALAALREIARSEGIPGDNLRIVPRFGSDIPEPPEYPD